MEFSLEHLQPKERASFALRSSFEGLLHGNANFFRGFPPGWTDIPSASDSARYRALGNSVPVPCVEFIMKSLQAVAAMEVDDERSKAQGDHHAEE